MEAIAHDPEFAKKVGVPQKVGRDFATADKVQGLYRGRKSRRMAWPKTATAHTAG